MMKKNNVTRGSGLLEEFLAKKRANLANKFITEGYRDGRILDVGCGSYPYFLITTKFKEKYGVDQVINLEVVKEKDIKLNNFTIGAKKFPFEDSFFDVVTMLAVFEHIDNEKLKFVLSEVRKVLKKNGLFIITTPAPWSDKLLHFMARVGLISPEEIHEHKHNYSKEKIEDIIKNGGFKKANIRSGFFELGMNMWFTAKND
jgi:ubiquinone/menaquinone biosynthesis C-methylase UbiE